MELRELRMPTRILSLKNILSHFSIISFEIAFNFLTSNDKKLIFLERLISEINKVSLEKAKNMYGYQKFPEWCKNGQNKALLKWFDDEQQVK